MGVPKGYSKKSFNIRNDLLDKFIDEADENTRSDTEQLNHILKERYKVAK